MSRTAVTEGAESRTSTHRTRRLIVALGAIFAIALIGAGTAFAFWSYIDSSNAHTAEAVAGSVGTGQQPSLVSVSGRDVSISWTAATHASSYTVARANVAPGSLSATVTSTCAGSVSGTSCTDAGLPENGTSATTWTYTDTPFLDNWQGTASTASAVVSVPAPTLSLGKTVLTAGGTTSATVANFFDNEGVTYCLAQTSPCSAANTLGTATVPASGGTVTTPTITIPASLGLGAHTVYAIGNHSPTGSLASIPITVGGTARKLAFVSGPSAVVAGQTMSPAVTVQVEDSTGNATPDSGVTVTVATTPNVTVAGNTATTNANGLATFNSMVINTAGSYTLKASATGLTATPASASFTVSKASTTTSLSLSSSAVTYGNEQSNTFTATVAPQFTGTPTGTVTVKSGATTLCTMTLPATTCTSTSTALNASGTAYAVTATYAGNANFTTSTSTAQNLTVSPDSATVSAFTVTGNPASYGSETSLVFHATVTAGHGETIPNTDKVSVTQGATTICTITLTSGSGTCSPTSSTVLGLGISTVTATFNSNGLDPNFITTATNTVNVTVNPASATVSAFTITGTPVTYGSETGLVFHSTVTSGLSIPNGDTVTVTQGATAICTITLTSSTGTCSPTSGTVLGGGTSTVTATFNSTGLDPNFITTAAKTANVTVNPASATVSTFTVTGSPVTYGAETSLVFSSTVTSAQAIPDGDTVTVTQGVTPICTITLTSLAGSCSPTSGTVLAGGTATVTATFNGDGSDPNFITTATKTANVTVSKANQTIAFTSAAPTTAADNGTYTPTVPATSGLTVALTRDSSTSTAVCSVAGGVVTFNGPGTCLVDANQAGNGNYNAAVQVQQSITVFTGVLVFTTPAVSGAASATPNLGPITIEREDGAGNPLTTGTVTITGSSSPSAGATFGATQFGAPAPPTVTFNPGTSSASFYYGQTAIGPSTVTATGAGYVTATQTETITAPPAGLAMALATGSSGTPHIVCGSIGTSYTCNVTGVGNNGNVKFFVEFVDASGAPIVYSSTQDSPITETGASTGTPTIVAGTSSSSPTKVTAAHTGGGTGTSTLTFGPYTLTINVSS
jgi:hypothetical protein